MGFTLGGRRYSGWETGEGMCAMEEQARHEFARSGLKLGVGRLSDARVSSNKLDPARAE